MLLIGSAALLHHTCGGDPLNTRIPNDTDYIATHDEARQFIEQEGFKSVVPNAKGTTLMCFGKGKPVEIMIAWPGSSTEDILNLEESMRGGYLGNLAASLNSLYLLKMSHRYLKNSPHFIKTRNDIMAMRRMGATIEHPDILAKREKETYDYKHPSLMRNKKNFFDPSEGVPYKYDHDTIHLAMATEPLKPAYTFFKNDQAEVMIDRQKWDSMPLAVQLNSVLEESYVLALERSQIPHRNKISPERSFRMALQKVCTSISSGWWREFAWEHHSEVMGLFDSTYVNRFDAAVEAGIVKELAGAHHV